MAGLFQYEELEDDINVSEFTQDQNDEYLLHSILNELASVFQHSQADFGLGDLRVRKTFPDERKNMRRTRCKTSDDLRAMPFLASHNYETNEDLSKRVIEYVSEFIKLKDLIFRFGPKPFLTYVKGLQSSRQEETFKVLVAAIKIEESWIPWF